MNKFSFFSDLVNTLFDKKNRKKNFSFLFEKKQNKSLLEYIKNVNEAKGEISALNYSEELFDYLSNCDHKTLISFFEHLEKDFDIEIASIPEILKNYNKKKEYNFYKDIKETFESKRLEIFRRLNSTQHGTINLVKLREKLLDLLDKYPNFRKIDFDLSSLFKDWFNRGFLILKPIDWETPANILEKIIEYEAVHQIKSWDELRSRLEPEDRKCFAYFHPAMQDEPLIFIEVALTENIPEKINQILNSDRAMINSQEATTAVFYSISNCQKGLQGISFGNFLIKQVARNLQKNFKSLSKFVTLSPVPGFSKWLKSNDAILFNKMHNKLSLNKIQKNEAILNETVLKYFFISNRSDNLPNDPVARFHLGNGAILEKINFLSNISENGLEQSLGYMVNYLYNLEEVELNHEKYVVDKKINTSKSLVKEYNTKC
ncbi:MAG: malonyl-CoA decarboxylase domain-containing protein [Candidatus Puniceispirillales bacterium]